MNHDIYSALRNKMREIMRRNSTSEPQNAKRRINESAYRIAKRAKTQLNTFSAHNKTLTVPKKASAAPVHPGFDNNSFPIEVLQHIWSFLPSEDILSISLVCIAWKKSTDAIFRARFFALRGNIPQMSFEKCAFFSMRETLAFVFDYMDRNIPHYLFDRFKDREVDGWQCWLAESRLVKLFTDFIEPVFSRWSAVTVVKYIIDNYKSNYFKKNDSGKLLLHFIVLSKSTEAVKLLLEAGANPNVTLIKEMGCLKPLHLLLCAFADDYNSTPHEVTYNIAELLLRYGTDVDKKVNEEASSTFDFYGQYVAYVYEHGGYNPEMGIEERKIKGAMCAKLFALLACYSSTEKYKEVMECKDPYELSETFKDEVQAHIVQIKSNMSLQQLDIVDTLKPPAPNCLELRPSKL